MVPYAAAQSAFPTVLSFGYEPPHGAAWQLFTLPSPLSRGQPVAAGTFGVGVVPVGKGVGVTAQTESAFAPLT